MWRLMFFSRTALPGHTIMKLSLNKFHPCGHYFLLSFFGLLLLSGNNLNRRDIKQSQLLFHTIVPPSLLSFSIFPCRRTIQSAFIIVLSSSSWVPVSLCTASDNLSFYLSMKLGKPQSW